MRRVLVTGVTGFAGSHLVDYLLTRGDCEIFGIQRWRSRTENIEHFRDKISLLECDLRDATSTRDTLEKVHPDWIFHLAAQSFVPTSWTAPTESLTTNVIGQVNIFEAVRHVGLKPRIQLACSSEEYGMVFPGEVPIKETNPLRPLSPYAVSKVAQDLLGYQYWMSWKLDCVRTRGFNHEGPRRGPVFVASDFAKQIADIEKGRKPPVLSVGNLEATRDFTDVRDMVRAYWLALETGAAGFVGLHLARALAECGARVHGLGNDPPRGELSLEGWHAADLRHPEGLASVIAAVRPDFVVHLAGQTSAARSFERPIET